jgi:hypothetical protein
VWLNIWCFFSDSVDDSTAVLTLDMTDITDSILFHGDIFIAVLRVIRIINKQFCNVINFVFLLIYNNIEIFPIVQLSPGQFWLKQNTKFGLRNPELEIVQTLSGILG